jgi:integrase
MTRRQLESDTATATLIAWRDRYEDTPRKADYQVTVLKAVLKHARTMGWLKSDPCTPIESLYYCDRSEIVWDKWEVDTLCAAMQPDMARAVQFMWLTGLRRGDAVAARWDTIQDGVLTMRTSKSKGRAKHVVYIEAELAVLLQEAPRRAVTILTTPDGRPYSPNSITQGLVRALRRIRATSPTFAAGKRLHDLRGSHATNLVAEALASKSVRQGMGWTEGKTNAPDRYVSPVVALASARNLARKNTS